MAGGGGGSHDSGSLKFFSQLRSFNHSTSANHVKNMHNDAGLEFRQKIYLSDGQVLGLMK